MSVENKLLLLTVAAVLAGAGSALADDCEEQLAGFEASLESAYLSNSDRDRYERRLRHAKGFAYENRGPACVHLLRHLSAELDAHLATSSRRARALDGTGGVYGEPIDDHRQGAAPAPAAAAADGRNSETSNRPINALGVAELAGTTVGDLEDDVLDLSGAEVGELAGFVYAVEDGDTFAVVELDQGWFSEKEVVVPVAEFYVNRAYELIYTGAIKLGNAATFDADAYQKISKSQAVMDLSAGRL